MVNIPPPPTAFVTSDPMFNRWLQDISNRSQLFNGIIAPVAAQGKNDDWYADTAAQHIYVKVSGAWVLIV